MHIVLLTQWYTPEPTQLISGLAQTLSEFGHDVTVLTGFPNYPAGRLYPGYRLRLWQRETIKGVKIVRVPLFPSHDASAIKRAINYISFAFCASLFGWFLLRRPQVIHVYHPPLTALAPGWFLSRLFRVPFTLEIQDMWPETLSATGMVSSQRLLRIVGWTAKWFYRRAAAIRVISKGFAENLESKYISPDKIHVIPNWSDTQTVGLANDAKAVPLTEAGCFNVLFAGNMGFAQGLENVLDAAELLRDIPKVRFCFVGDGIDLERLTKIASHRTLGNVRFLGRRPADEMPTLFAQADVLLVHLRDDPLFRITIPHKVYSYMASGKPVLVAASGDVADTVVSAHAGVACAPGDPAALAKTVRELWKMAPKDRQKMGENGKRTVHEQYSREHVVRQVEKMITSVVNVA